MNPEQIYFIVGFFLGVLLIVSVLVAIWLVYKEAPN